MLRDIRKQYELSYLDENSVNPNPSAQFEQWLAEAIASTQLEPTAMVLSTVDKGLRPQSRVVLLKDFSNDGLKFYTNYNGHKAQQMELNKQVSVVFFWPSLERQVRIAGVVEKLSESESTEYFHSRPADSQLGAWASPQSQVIASHEVLEDNLKTFNDKFGENIPKPPHWGGYLIRPTSFEFWQGRPNRLHDRLLFSLGNGNWKMERLAP